MTRWTETSRVECRRSPETEPTWQTVPHMGSSNRKCSAANSGTVNRRLDEAVAAVHLTLHKKKTTTYTRYARGWRRIQSTIISSWVLVLLLYMQLINWGYQLLTYLIITELPSLLKSDITVCNYSVKTWYCQMASIRFGVWLVSGYANVCILVSVVTVRLPQ